MARISELLVLTEASIGMHHFNHSTRMLWLLSSNVYVVTYELS